MYFSSLIIADFMAYARLKAADVQGLEPEAATLQKDKYVSYGQMISLMSQLVQALKDEQLGLHLGEQLSLKVTAYVDSIMQHSLTLEDAFENAVKYSRLISDALDCHLKKADAHYSVIFTENPDWQVQPAQAKRQILDLTLLSCLKSLTAYTGQRYYPVRISFSHSKPRNLSDYYRLFNCSLQFSQPQTEIIFERQLFDKRSKEGKLGLVESLKAMVELEVARLSQENSLIYELKKLILAHKPKRLSIEEAAGLLNLSKRTLQRKLGTTGTSYKAIERELQLRLAKTYLEEGQKSVDEISYLLGFSESSAFIRFFKAKAGVAPMGYSTLFKP